MNGEEIVFFEEEVDAHLLAKLDLMALAESSCILKLAFAK